MIPAHCNIMIMLFFSWSVYAYCQHDSLLPIIAGSIVLLSIVLRFNALDKRFIAIDKMPLSVTIILSYLAGMLWRYIIPIPEEANAPFLDFTSAVQSGSIVAGAILSLRPFTQKNIYHIGACAWLTVPVSVNVPFTQDMLLIFAAFTFIAVAIVIIETMRRPNNPKHLFLYTRDYIIFAVLLVSLTTLLFLAISWSIVVRERAFFNLMGNYILPRHYTHFLNISPTLNLITPGVSAMDRRPVIEISLPQGTSPYLRMQLFDRYNNGTWSEPRHVIKKNLPDQLNSDQSTGKFLLFVPLKDHVPLPSGISAIQSKSPYLKSKDGIIYSDGPQNTRIAEFSLTPLEKPVKLSDAQRAQYTALPPAIAKQLQTFAYTISAPQNDARLTAIKTTEYFHRNFSYSLDVNFTADNKGLIKMLEEKRPAYCTYFASALTLLLRAHGIPARVAAGFLTTEKTNTQQNTYLARVRNAHAWTEALLPYVDPLTGETHYYWQTLDATPPSMQAQLHKTSAALYLERALEGMWLNGLRLKATLENTDKDLIKIYIIFLLLGVMAFINRKQILTYLKDQRIMKHRVKLSSTTQPSALPKIYAAYERYLMDEFNLKRGQCETDMELLNRIRNSSTVKKNTAVAIENFIQSFHAVRFGVIEKDITSLDGLVAKLPRTARTQDQSHPE